MTNVGVARAIPAVVAHQGGWDEILLVAGPMLVVVALLWLAKRRVTRAQPPPVDEDGTRSIAAPTARNRPTRSS